MRNLSISRVAWRSIIFSLAAVSASFLITMVFVPHLGISVGLDVWFICTVPPLTIAWPASAYTFWQRSRLKSAHRDLARAHAQLAAAHRRLEEKAARDDMTGLLNRESFFAVLDGSRHQPERGTLLIIDADHFKAVNDGFGHLTGDEALLLIVEAIRRGVRSGDVLGRIGGEEFGALLVGASEQEARLVAERIRSEVESIRFRPGGERIVPLTVSIGGMVCARGVGVSDLMRGADRQLYEAKHRGRNLVMLKQGLSAAA